MTQVLSGYYIFTHELIEGGGAIQPRGLLLKEQVRTVVFAPRVEQSYTSLTCAGRNLPDRSGNAGGAVLIPASSVLPDRH